MIRSSPCAISETGRRETNQDRVCAESTTVLGEAAWLLAVADGMGGMSAGDDAAQIAIDTVREYAAGALTTVTSGPPALADALADMFREANRRIWDRSVRDGRSGEMGTTLVCCLLFGDRYLVANAGDSRCYYINDREVRQLTEDHSQVQDMVRRGAMTEAAARKSPYRNQLTNCLGEPHEIRVDLFPGRENYGVIDEPAVLLLSSDGFHGSLSPAEVHARIRATRTVAEACDDLVTLAMENGSTDNTSVVAIEFGRLRSRKVVEKPVSPVTTGPVTVKLRTPLYRPSPPRRRLRLSRAAAAAAGVVLVATATVVWTFPKWRPIVSWLVPAPAAATVSRTVPPLPSRSMSPVFAPPGVSLEETRQAGPRSTPIPAAPPPAKALPAPAQGPSEPAIDPATSKASTATWEPVLAATVSGRVVTFDWHAGAKGAVTYRVEVSRDPSFRKPYVLTPSAAAPLSVEWHPDRDISGALYARVVLLARGAPPRRSSAISLGLPVESKDR